MLGLNLSPFEDLSGSLGYLISENERWGMGDERYDGGRQRRDLAQRESQRSGQCGSEVDSSKLRSGERRAR